MKAFLLLSVGLVLESTSLAASITTPSNALSGDMPFGNRFPFDPDGSSMRYQQVYDASFFSSAGEAILISELRFRPDVALSGGTSGPFSATISDIEIRLSTTSRPSESLLTQFSLNVGSDEMVVYNRGPSSLQCIRR